MLNRFKTVCFSKRPTLYLQHYVLNGNSLKAILPLCAQEHQRKRKFAQREGKRHFHITFVCLVHCSVLSNNSECRSSDYCYFEPSYFQIRVQADIAFWEEGIKYQKMLLIMLGRMIFNHISGEKIDNVITITHKS